MFASAKSVVGSEAAKGVNTRVASDVRIRLQFERKFRGARISLAGVQTTFSKPCFSQGKCGFFRACIRASGSASRGGYVCAGFLLPNKKKPGFDWAWVGMLPKRGRRIFKWSAECEAPKRLFHREVVFRATGRWSILQSGYAPVLNMVFEQKWATLDTLGTKETRSYRIA